MTTNLLDLDAALSPFLASLAVVTWYSSEYADSPLAKRTAELLEGR